jgi:hypothetical protein
LKQHDNKNTHQLIKKVKARVIFDEDVLIGANKTEDVAIRFLFSKNIFD